MAQTSTLALEELVPVDIEKDIDESDTISLGSQEQRSEPDESLEQEQEGTEEEAEEEEMVEEEEGEGEAEEGDEEGARAPPIATAVAAPVDTAAAAPADTATDDETDEDDESEDENAFKKLEQDVQREYLEKFHPETKQINFSELLALAKVTRNGEGRIIDILHKTIPFMTKYEKTRILGLRTTQINNGSEIFVNVDKDVIDGYVIAELELKAKKIPFIIRRPLPNGASEYWRVEDLEIINY